MGIFNRTTPKAMISQPPRKAAAAGSYMQSQNNGGAKAIGIYYSYVDGEKRNSAMAQPTISRARDLICTFISCMNLRMYNEMWNGTEMEKVYIAPRAWLKKLIQQYQTISF